MPEIDPNKIPTKEEWYLMLSIDFESAIKYAMKLERERCAYIAQSFGTIEATAIADRIMKKDD